MFKSFLAGILVLIFCVGNAQACAKVDYGDSKIYSRADMDFAIELIREQFGAWRGCKLHNIRYGGDAANSAENIAWLNDIAPGHGYEPNFVQCMEFLSDFYVSSEAEKYTTFNPDSEYKNWQWWLARAEGGDWILVSWGY